MHFFRSPNMGILEVILLVGAAMIVLAIVIGFCCHCLHPQGKVKNDELAQRKTPSMRQMFQQRLIILTLRPGGMTPH